LEQRSSDKIRATNRGTGTMPADDQLEVLRVDNEATAVEILKQALENAYEGESVKLDFEDWPVLRLKYTGEKFNGTISAGDC
jgi:hypothetical protein